jgi:hypothetical protein
VTLVGEGFSAAKRDLRARVTLNPDPAEAGLLDAGFAELRLRGGASDFRTVARSGSGTVTLAGTAKFGPELELQVHRGVIKRLDVAAVAGGSDVSSLDAEFILKSRGTSPRTASAQARLSQVSLVYGSGTFDQGRIQLNLDGGAVDVRGSGRLNGDSVAVSARAHPFLATPSLARRDIPLSRLQLGSLLPDAGLYGENAGTARRLADDRARLWVPANACHALRVSGRRGRPRGGRTSSMPQCRDGDRHREQRTVRHPGTHRFGTRSPAPAPGFRPASN